MRVSYTATIAYLTNCLCLIGDRKFDNDVPFRKFKRQLYHSSIAAILRTLGPAMTTLVVRQCPDGHWRRVIYDLAAFIADYPEQVLLAGIVQNWCPKYVYTIISLRRPFMTNCYIQMHRKTYQS